MSQYRTTFLAISHHFAKNRNRSYHYSFCAVLTFHEYFLAFYNASRHFCIISQHLTILCIVRSVSIAQYLVVYRIISQPFVVFSSTALFRSISQFCQLFHCISHHICIVSQGFVLFRSAVHSSHCSVAFRSSLYYFAEFRFTSLCFDL